MVVTRLKCPKCGFGFLPDDLDQQLVCPKCSTEFSVPAEVEYRPGIDSKAVRPVAIAVLAVLLLLTITGLIFLML